MVLVYLQISLIALGLAMDAVGVSIAGGMKSQSSKISQAFKVAAFFGAFQVVMPIVGWYFGEIMQNTLSSVDHWIAFVLLGMIGVKMIKDALKNEKEQKEIINNKTLILLSVATSIDALIIGITIPLLNIPLLATAAVIGIVTFTLSFLGFLFGKQLGIIFGKRIGVLAGVALIAIGFKILLEHLFVS